MTPTIKELDGLPSGEIALMVANSEMKMVTAMDQKFREHRELIENRLDAQDENLSSVDKSLSTLVGSGNLPGLVTQIKEIVDNNARSFKQFTVQQTAQMSLQSEWHNESLAYRKTAEASRDDIIGRMEKVESQVMSMRWMVSSVRGIVRASRGCANILKAAEVWKLTGVGVLLLLLNKLSPQLFHLLLKIIHTR